jgi:hypothetical protein
VVTGKDTLTLGQGQTLRLTVADENCDNVPKFNNFRTPDPIFEIQAIIGF